MENFNLINTFFTKYPLAQTQRELSKTVEGMQSNYANIPEMTEDDFILRRDEFDTFVHFSFQGGDGELLVFFKRGEDKNKIFRLPFNFDERRYFEFAEQITQHKYVVSYVDFEMVGETKNGLAWDILTDICFLGKNYRPIEEFGSRDSLPVDVLYEPVTFDPEKHVLFSKETALGGCTYQMLITHSGRLLLDKNCDLIVLPENIEFSKTRLGVIWGCETLKTLPTNIEPCFIYA